MSLCLSPHPEELTSAFTEVSVSKGEGGHPSLWQSFETPAGAIAPQALRMRAVCVEAVPQRKNLSNSGRLTSADTATIA